MSAATSPATGRRYPVSMILEAFDLPRSSFYDWQQRQASPDGHEAPKRGPKTDVTDEQVLEALREELEDPEFSGEGYKKLHARLRRLRGLVVGKNRVLRLMRQHGLLAPVRRRHRRGDRAHTGTIVTDEIDRMWGTDATRFYTAEDGWCWFFGAIDHHADDIVGHHVAKIGDRFAALEPIRQGIQRYFGASGADVARGLSIRHDWGTQYMSHEFQGELRFLGVQSSPSYVGEPECNGVIERFMRTLKEHCIYVHRFRNLEHAREVIDDFIDRYNRLWLIERNGHRTPLEVREAASLSPAA